MITMLEERVIGTVTVRVVHMPEIGVYSIAMVDTFGFVDSHAVRRLPCDRCVEQAVARHVQKSQVFTRRN